MESDLVVPSNSLALALTTAIVTVLVMDLRHDIRRLIRARNVMMIVYLGWYMIEAVTVPDALSAYSQETYDQGVLFVGLSFLSFMVAYHKSGGSKLLSDQIHRIELLEDPRVLWKVVVLCAIIGFTPILYYSGFRVYDLLVGIMGMRKSWGGLLMRGRYGGFREALLMLEMFVTGAGPFAMILLLDKRVKFEQKLLCIVVAVWPIMRGWGSGTRSALITSLLPVMAIIYFKVSDRWQKIMAWSAIASIPFIIILMRSIVESRGGGEFEITTDGGYVGYEMFREFLYIIESFPDRIQYQEGMTYFVQLVNPIPRFLWEGKPSGDAGLLLARAQGNLQEGETVSMTVSPGAIGEMYMNFGVLGVIGISALVGYLIRTWDLIGEKINHRPYLALRVYYVMGLAVILIMGRSFNMNHLYGLGSFYIGSLMLIRWSFPTAQVSSTGTAEGYMAKPSWLE